MAVKEKRMKILVVDDDQEMREMIYSFLTYRGFYVKTMKDGINGLAELKKDSYDSNAETDRAQKFPVIHGMWCTSCIMSFDSP